MDPHTAAPDASSRSSSGGSGTREPAGATVPAARGGRGASGSIRKSDFRDPRLDRETRRLLKKQFKREQKQLRQQFRLERREHRRLRLRRHGRRAYIRSAYSLPSLATLGNAVCGFGAMYVATLDE